MEYKLLKDKNKKRVALSCDRTKKFPTVTLINIFIVSLMLLFATAYAEENNWVYAGAIDDNLFFVNTDLITCSENICRAWVKLLLPIEKHEYNISLNEYNCMDMKYKILRSTTYDSDGNTIRDFSPTESGRRYTVPESISKELSDYICKKASYPKKAIFRGKIAEGKKETESKSPQSRETSDAIFTVQVGVFSNASYAEAFAKRLNEKGYRVYITFSISQKGEGLHKVHIGTFSDRKKAENLSARIKKTEGLQAFVTLR
jgi:hypothetical protein